MTVQFELGSKHQENKKQANAIISEMVNTNTKEIVKDLYSKSFGYLPSEKAFYDDYLGLVVSLEEIAKVNPAVASVIVDQVLVQELLAKYAVNNASFNSNEVYALLCAEPGIADFKGLTTVAVKNGGNWHIEGKKLVRKEHLLADKYLIYAKDEDNNVRVFMTSVEDIKVNQLTKNIAGTEVNLNQIELNIDLPENANIALINDDAEKNLCIARTLIASVALGIAHSSIVAGIGASKEVKGPDKLAVSTTQGVQFTLADMYTELEAGRMLTYYSADLIDNNKANIKYATMAKVQATDAASQLSVQALQLLGNLGYLANNDFADIIRMAVDGQTKGGTNRVQRNHIYQYMLAKK